MLRPAARMAPPCAPLKLNHQPLSPPPTLPPAWAPRLPPRRASLGQQQAGGDGGLLGGLAGVASEAQLKEAAAAAAGELAGAV